MSTEGTCLVTGAAGFVGSVLIRRLSERGWRVTGADRLQVPTERATPGVSSIRIDLNDHVAVQELTKKLRPQLVFHLAAQPYVPRSLTEPYETVMDNVGALAAVLEAARQADVARVIHASSGAVYGSEPGLNFYTEDSPRLGSASLYGPTKIAAEYVAQAYTQAFGMDVRIGRFMNTYGPGDLSKSRIVPTAIRLALDNLPYDFGSRDDGTTTLDFVYIDDVVDAYIAAAVADVGRGTIFNFGAGGGMELRTVVGLISQIVDGRDREAVFSGPPPAQPRGKALDISRTSEILGWKPRVGLAEGLARTVDWHRQRGKR